METHGRRKGWRDPSIPARLAPPLGLGSRPSRSPGLREGQLRVATYVLKRAVSLVAILLLVSVGTFFLVHLLPGNPAISVLGPDATPSNVAAVDRQLGLTKPLFQQYFVWLGNVLHGNLGRSFIDHEPVTTTIAHAYPIDVELLVISQFFAVVAAVPLALLAARRPLKGLDRIATTGSFVMLSMPPIVLAPILLLLLSVDTHVFPGPASYVPITQDLWSNLHAMLLPSIVLALGSFVLYYRLLRNDLLATLREDFITMARAKGLSERRILLLHALRPSSVSVLASAGVTIAGLLAGAFVVEYLFQLPGLGYVLVGSINQDDFITVQGIVLVVAVAVVVVNFTLDLLFTVVDPRIAHE
jgi:peptide/nickel transport system permease protein